MRSVWRVLGDALMTSLRSVSAADVTRPTCVWPDCTMQLCDISYVFVSITVRELLRPNSTRRTGHENPSL